MFEGRFGELLIIFVLALVILGPEKLPRVVAEFGRWVGRARAMARQFREQLEEEVRFEENRKAQAARPPDPPPAEPPPASPPPLDVAEAMNPHTEAPAAPPVEAPVMDVSALPPELAQAATASVAPPPPAPHPEAPAETTAAPARTPVSEGQPS